MGPSQPVRGPRIPSDLAVKQESPGVSVDAVLKFAVTGLEYGTGGGEGEAAATDRKELTRAR